MQITALIQVINYLKEISGNPAILEGYKRLADIIKDASGDPDSNSPEAIFIEKEELCKLLLENDPSAWGYASYSLFEKINNNQLFGKAATNYLDNLITPENLDYKAIYSDLSRKIKLISKLSDTVNRFLQMFDQLVPSDVFHLSEDPDNKFSLFLYLEGRLTIQNISDMERYSRLWDGILNAFSRLTGEEKLTLDIRSFQNGNIVLGAPAKDKTLNAFKTGVVGMLDSLSLILKIRKMQIEITRLPLYHDLNELLEEEIQMLVNKKALELTQELISGYSSDTYISEEITSDLSRVLKQILSFVERGGRVEFRPAVSSPEVVKTNAALNEFYAITHELESVTDSLAEALAKNDKLVDDDKPGMPSEYIEQQE
jgi:hypothetical protein